MKKSTVRVAVLGLAMVAVVGTWFAAKEARASMVTELQGTTCEAVTRATWDAMARVRRVAPEATDGFYYGVPKWSDVAGLSDACTPHTGLQ